MNRYDPTDPAQLLATHEGITTLLTNLTAVEFTELCSSLRILASSQMPRSRDYAVTDLRTTLAGAAARIALIHVAARAHHAARAAHTQGRH